MRPARPLALPGLLASLAIAAAALAPAALAPAALAQEAAMGIERDEASGILFRSALTNQPMRFEHRTDQAITPEVEAFRQSGENPYGGDAAALEAGEDLYAQLCQACHMPDGSGRIGPNLSDDAWVRDRTHTDVGRFEIIYGGGAGAMQAFGRRIDQDEILKVMAYIDTLRVDG